MKIHINIDENLSETEITINCKFMSEDIERWIAMLRMADLKLTGEKDQQTHILDASKILYIDTVDKKTFFYTSSDIYETALKLYELEEKLVTQDFLRANKSCVINLNHIAALKSDIDGRLIVTMDNGEKLTISRQYATLIKKKLGAK